MFFCGSDASYLPEVGISLSMGGYELSFCNTCLENMTASEFWEKIFRSEGLAWPPRLIGKNPNSPRYEEG